jgi:hypothetical protein
MPGAFSGERAVDIAHVLAGPFASDQLAPLRAEVIAVGSSPEPDQARFYGFDRADRGGHGRHLSVARAGRKGAAAGYPDRTGQRRGRTGYDNAIQAFCAMMDLTGHGDDRPLKCGAPAIDCAAGRMAAFAMSAALFQRASVRMGQRIDLSTLNAADAPRNRFPEVAQAPQGRGQPLRLRQLEDVSRRTQPAPATPPVDRAAARGSGEVLEPAARRGPPAHDVVFRRRGHRRRGGRGGPLCHRRSGRRAGGGVRGWRHETCR